VLQLNAPKSPWYLPAAQLVHELVPYVPAAQVAKHAVAPADEYVPEPQATQLVALDMVENVLAPQLEQALAPVAEYWPTEHAVQMRALLPEKAPAAQFEQADCPAAGAILPAGQVRHCAAAAAAYWPVAQAEQLEARATPVVAW